MKHTKSRSTTKSTTKRQPEEEDSRANWRRLSEQLMEAGMAITGIGFVLLCMIGFNAKEDAE